MRSPFPRPKSPLAKTAPSSEGSPSPPSQRSSEKISITSESSSMTQRSRYLSSQPPSPLTQQSSQQSIPTCRSARCPSCGEPCKRFTTKTSNRNGNAGRPYYKCVRCGKFMCFDDPRGEDEKNPLCDCGNNSRRQLSNREKGRRIFYACKTGSCEFFQFHRRRDGSIWSVNEDMAHALSKLGIV